MQTKTNIIVTLLSWMIFILLRIFNIIDWSWSFILSPLWIAALFFFSLFLVYFFHDVLKKLFKK